MVRHTETHVEGVVLDMEQSNEVRNRQIETFYRYAKEGGDRLRGYMLAGSVLGIGLFMFLPGMPGDSGIFMLGAVLAYFVTMVLCLVELRMESVRYYTIAKELEKPEDEQDWKKNEETKELHISWQQVSRFFFGAGLLCTALFFVVVFF
jgi:hypothetical protein